jgi:CP family cyanate transporter-like MFS transporter
VAIFFAIPTSSYVFKTKNQLWASVSAPIITGTGLLLLILGGAALALPAVIIIGIGSGICTGIAFFLPVLRTSHFSNTGKLNAMAQSIGYLFAALGPLLSGLLKDISGSWLLTLYLLLGALMLQFCSGLIVGRNVYVDAH